MRRRGRRCRKGVPNSTTEPKKKKFRSHFRALGSRTGGCRRRRLSRIVLKFGGASVDARRAYYYTAGHAHRSDTLFAYTTALHTTSGTRCFFSQRRSGAAVEITPQRFMVSRSLGRPPSHVSRFVSSGRDFPLLIAIFSSRQEARDDAWRNT